MTVDVDALGTYIGTASTDPVLATLLPVAIDLIDEDLKDHKHEVPDSVYDLAVTQLVSELYSRKNAPGGIMWGPAGDVTAAPSARLSRDALTSVRPLYRSYKGLGSAG